MPITKSDVLSLIQDAEERNLLKERSEDKYKNQSCYIIGNGQSIKFFDLKKFSKKKKLEIFKIFIK